MRKLFLALALTMAACLAAAAVAAADPGPPVPVQVDGQTATTAQQAGAASSATQVDPSNVNVSIRVLSPGNDGDVTQTNNATSSATAGNQAGTTQSADQDAGGAGIQTSQQSAGTDQLALALSAAKQDDPSNVNVPLRVLSPGDDGSVTQANNAGSQASAGNAATTTQTSSQDPSGASCGCSGPDIQTAKQDASTGQAAGAASTAEQDHPTNTNLSIRVLSPGDDGSVTQTNSVSSSATAGNTAATTQNATQSQGGSGCGCTSTPRTTDDGKPSAPPADTTHDSSPSDHADLSHGGPVSQQNSDASTAGAGNGASTDQTASQTAGSGSGVQTGDQHAETDQLAGAISDATQIHPSNTSGSIRVLSPGDDGSVTQTNSVSSTASSGNEATTTQNASQSQAGSCGCYQPDHASSSPGSASGPAIQISGQDASTGQASFAGSSAEQVGASNDASPVRVWSKGDGGNVTQSNTDTSSATSGNSAETNQDADQVASPGGCHCSGPPIQVTGQKANTLQGSLAISKALQLFLGGKDSPCGCGGGKSGNVASPVRVWSPGDDGDVSQTNAVTSTASSGNGASTDQQASQDAGGGGLQIQALGQEATTGQLAFAASLAAQFGARNDASPTRVLSPGGGGSVTQSNSASSSAPAGNEAGTTQNADQSTGASPCGCGGLTIQALGQKADTGQLAKALSSAFQLDPTNVSSPVRVWSWDAIKPMLEGHGGSQGGNAPPEHSNSDGEAQSS